MPLGLRTRTRPGKQYAGLSPVLFYLYAEPDLLPNSSKRISDEAKAVHRDEIRRFAQSVRSDEVKIRGLHVPRPAGDGVEPRCKPADTRARESSGLSLFTIGGRGPQPERI